MERQNSNGLIKNFPEYDIEAMLKNIRRIKPSEYFCSGFLEDLPIRKADTDNILFMVEGVLSEKYNAVA